MSSYNDVEHTLQEAMTVRELIEQLAGYDQGARVVFVSDYGDIVHTQQALPVAEIDDAETTDLSTSAYSQSGIKLNDNEGDDNEEWYCEACDKFNTVGTCPKCNAVCVNEAGDKFDDEEKDKDEVLPIVVLR